MVNGDGGWLEPGWHVDADFGTGHREPSPAHPPLPGPDATAAPARHDCALPNRGRRFRPRGRGARPLGAADLCPRVTRDVRVDFRPPARPLLFSLSYSVLPERDPALDRAWQSLTPGGRLVIMDAGLPPARLDRLLRPFGEMIATVFPGELYSTPWEDLARISSTVQTEWFRRGLYFTCSALRQPDAGAGAEA